MFPVIPNSLRFLLGPINYRLGYSKYTVRMPSGETKTIWSNEDYAAIVAANPDANHINVKSRTHGIVAPILIRKDDEIYMYVSNGVAMEAVAKHYRDTGDYKYVTTNRKLVPTVKLIKG